MLSIKALLVIDELFIYKFSYYIKWSLHTLLVYSNGYVPLLINTLDTTVRVGICAD